VKRFTISSDARPIAYVAAIIGTVTIAPFGLMSRTRLAASVAKDVRPEGVRRNDSTRTYRSGNQTYQQMGLEQCSLKFIARNLHFTAHVIR